MVRQDILGGLKNALERGESLEQAKASFIDAGYPREEVEEAALALSRTPTLREIEIMPVPQKGTGGAEGAGIKEKKLKKMLPYLIIGIAVILIIAAAYFFLIKK